MDAIEKLNLVKNQYEDTQTLIRYSDSKAGSLLIGAGILVAAFVNFYIDMDMGWAEIAVSVSFSLLSISSIIIVMILVLYPRISISQSKLKEQLWRAREEEKSDLLDELDCNDIIEDYFLQTIEIEKILQQKNKFIRLSLSLLSCSAVPFLFMIFLSM